jgi:hypothetical protein
MAQENNGSSQGGFSPSPETELLGMTKKACSTLAEMLEKGVDLPDTVEEFAELIQRRQQ